MTKFNSHSLAGLAAALLTVLMVGQTYAVPAKAQSSGPTTVVLSELA